MILQGSELQKKDTVYALIKGTWKAAEVSDLSEPMKAAKITYVQDLRKGKFRSEWFSLADLSRTIN